MFDIGFTELLVIGLVALIVVGPERLPKVARTAGALLGRLQRYVADVKSDIHRELQVEELRKMQQQVQDSARDVELAISKEVHGVENTLNAAVAPNPGQAGSALDALTVPGEANVQTANAAGKSAAPLPASAESAAASVTVPPRSL